MPATRTGGQIVVDALLCHQVDTVFTVPGESFLPVLDALYAERARIRTVTCRLEIGAAFMAEAHGKVTGDPGVVLVSRGPGACNAAIGVHTASQDSTPMVILIGQVPRGHRHREAFQEIDYRGFYGPLCKTVLEVEQAARLPELLAQAFHCARSGRPGPVAVVLPEDVLAERAEVADAAPRAATLPGPAPADLAALGELLAGAERPLLIAGGGGWSARACADLARFAERHLLPVAAAFRRQDRLDNDHPCYVGALGVGASPALERRVREADLVIALGARLGAMTTGGYRLLEPPDPAQRLIHIHPDPLETGRVYRPELAVCAAVGPFTAAAAALEPPAAIGWRAWTEAARAEHLADREPTAGVRGAALDLAAVVAHLEARLPRGAIVTTDAGNFSGWMQRFFRYRAYPSQIGPTNGAMGYGVPAAIAARLACRDRPVVAWCGDGGVLMTGQELATAIHEGVDPVIIVVNNDMYGTIRLHQERRFPERVHGSSLTNPELSVWAQSFGAHGALVTRSEEFPAALERALGAGRAALIELRTGPEPITTRTTLSALREAR